MPWEGPLHSAVRRGCLTAVMILMTEETINSRNMGGFTPLNVACYCGHVPIIEALLEAGADIRLDDGEGWTPLHAACRSNQTAAVKLLLNEGAADCINVRAAASDTPLFVACKSKGDINGDIVQLLIDAGADVNAKNKKGRTPLMIATASKVLKKVELLMSSGAKLHAVDDKGMSALHLAVSCPEILELLVLNGADINLRDNRAETPLERKDISMKAISILLEHGAGNIPCLRHKTCRGSIVSCLYKAARTSANKGRNCFKYEAFEKHIIACEVAGLYAGQGLTLAQPALELNYWYILSRDEFRVKCEKEVAMLKTEKIPGTHSSYFDALLQRPYALKRIEPMSLESCRKKFNIYGNLIWFKYRSGVKKLALVDEAVDFFSVVENIPQLPPECVVEILSYLTEQDLKIAMFVYNSAKRRHARQQKNENNKRTNPDSSLQVMKYLKVE